MVIVTLFIESFHVYIPEFKTLVSKVSMEILSWVVNNIFSDLRPLKLDFVFTFCRHTESLRL